MPCDRVTASVTCETARGGGGVTGRRVAAPESGGAAAASPVWSVAQHSQTWTLAVSNNLIYINTS